MPVSEKIEQLEAQIRQRIERSFSDMREEILERFRNQSERLREQLEEMSAALPEGLFRESDLQPVLQEVSEEAKKREAQEREARESRDETATMAGVTEGLAALDRARSQSDLLRAVLGQCGRFASRAAVFLAQPGRLKGWGGHDLGEAETALRNLEIEAQDGSVWARLLAGRGVVRLSSSERAELSSRLEIPVPREAVLIPLVLRDRVAAAVYADQVGDDRLPVENLQAFTYMAALAIETLPLRQRESTATLQVEEPEPPREEPPAEAPGIAAEAAAAVVTEAPPVEVPPVQPPVQEAPPAAPPEAPPEAPPAAPISEPVAEAPEPAAPPPAVAPEPETEDRIELEMGDMDLGEVELETEVDLEDDMDLGGDMGLGGDMELGGAVELEVEEEISLDDLSAAPPAPTPEPPAVEPPRVEPPRMEPPRMEPPPAPAAPAPPLADAGGLSSVTEETRPGTEPGIGGQPLGAGGGAEVAPPSDVQGPGWAFSSGEEMDGDEEARHEEARRLARLLVSEIKLYNEEQVMEGRKSGDIFERLKEDIERSRQLYDARVDERVREKTDYFYQEMVRVLGAGDPKALGI